MIYAFIIIGFVFIAIAGLIWMRKVQFDAVHRNFLDLVDHYGGRVDRSGFAVRPRFSGSLNSSPISVSISAEKKTKDKPRQFYISVYLKMPAGANFTVFSNDWLKWRESERKQTAHTQDIADQKYIVEVSEEKLLENLNFQHIEEIIRKIDPIAYVLVSKRGLILERLSSNLVKDTEFEHLHELIEGMSELSRV
jgi:hypothetical protein